MCAYLAHKYSFLYAPSQSFFDACVARFQSVQVYVIYKVDNAYRHNYPLLNNDISHINSSSSSGNGNSNTNTSTFNVTQDNFSANLASSTPVRAPRYQQQPLPQADSSNGNINPQLTAPFRTVSHFGFNCPLANGPSILLYPLNQSIWQTVAEQRDRVVSFIDMTNLNFAKRQMLNVLSASCKRNKSVAQGRQQEVNDGQMSTSPSYVSTMHIKLEATPPRKQRNNSAVTNSTWPQSADDSLDGLTEQFSSLLSIQTPKADRHRDDDSLYPSNYTVRSFLPDNHLLPKDASVTADKPEAERSVYQNENDSGLGGTNINHSGNTTGSRRERRATSSNESSNQEAEAYSQGKHIRLTLSSSPEAESQLKSSSIEILINVSLRNMECVQTVQANEQEFRAKLEKVIDEEIHYISQQLAMKQRTVHLLQSSEQPPRAALASPASSSTQLLQRCNSAPALYHTYSYVALGDADPAAAPQAPPSTPTSTVHSFSEADALQRLLTALELELQHLLNSIIRAHELHNQAVIYDCRTRISQMRDDIKGVVKTTKIK